MVYRKQQVSRQGGIVAALHAGTIQADVAKVAAAKAQLVDQRRHGLIGVNLFANPKDALRKPPAVPHSAVEFPLASAPHSTRIEALKPRRAAEGFEALRLQMDAYAKKNKMRAKVFVAKMGPVAQHKARADFTAGFFSVAGFEMLAKQSFETAESAAKAAAESGASIAVLCSTDETYPVLAPAFARAAKAAHPCLTLVLAGYLSELIGELKQAGFDEFIHIRSNVRETLSTLMKKAGVA
jgi:methylmalonyl-CoA mutase